MSAPSGDSVTVASPAAMEALGCRFGESLCRIAASPAAASLAWPGLILGLEGDLGAGKTTFVRGLVVGVTGIDRVVTSPTFQLLNLYRPDDSSTRHRALAHIDAYRLTGAQAFWELGVADLLEDRMIVVVEWPSRTAHPIFETDAVMLQFDHIDEQTRQVTLLHRPTALATLRF